jgi:hypothetical protein
MVDSSGGGYQYLITEGAKGDLTQCAEEDGYAAAMIATVLREVRGSPAYLERMIDENFADEKVQDVTPVWSFQAKRINAYRTKLVVVRNWRLIFIVDRPTARIGLFAVMHRADDYEANADLWSSIEREFNELGFSYY